MQCRFHSQTGGSTLSAQQVDNNIVRTYPIIAINSDKLWNHLDRFANLLKIPILMAQDVERRLNSWCVVLSEVTAFLSILIYC